MSVLRIVALSLCLSATSWSWADDVSAIPVPETVKQLASLLEQPLLPPGRSLLQVQEFCEKRVCEIPAITSIEDWEMYVKDLRAKVLRDVVLRGEAAKWGAQPTEVEWLDTLETEHGYRIRKLRFQAVPGMFIPALLYEPTTISGKIPVFMNVNGHDSSGKVAAYKQARCINLAKRGLLVLNIEWVGMGQLRSPDFTHYRMNQLDLCGSSGIAPFYLSMKRGLDILLQHESADPTRVGVAGLSGGGWQTIFISGLDERVTLSNPVAGYSSYKTRARVFSDLGDSEQTPSDLAEVIDFTHLTAFRAPHFTLLSNNDRDRCCFAAGHALPPLLGAARPIYRMYDVPDNLWVHINHVPGSHNFEQDNREALYRFVGAKFFPGEEFHVREIPCEHELMTREQLDVPLPEGNKGFHSIALELAQDLPRVASGDAEEQRARLSRILRRQRQPVTGDTVTDLGTWQEATVTGHVWQVGKDWSVPGVDINPPNSTNVVLIVSDGGRRTAAKRIAELVSSGSRVIAIDPFYFGESRVPTHDFLFGLLIASTGNRPLGVQVDQLSAVAQHLIQKNPKERLAIEAFGRRTGLIATLTAATTTETFSSVSLNGSFESLHDILKEDIAVNEAPELFCFGLLEHFDLPQIESLAAPVTITGRVDSVRPNEPEVAK
ncbi:MAG: hypothetical protein R3C01_01620 [Planctomycetaceae bacterium]